MGGGPSKDAADEERKPFEMTDEMQTALDDNTYYPGTNAKYPYFLIQLNEDGELPCGENDDILMSDCVAAYCASHAVTHLIVQTHGWNTTAQKAVAVPFTEFMGGMQNDAAMPSDDGESFKPVFIAFIWPAVPYDFLKEEDALTRAELLINSEKESSVNGVGEDTDVGRAAQAVKNAIENDEMEDNAALDDEMKTLAQAMKDEDDDDEDEPDDDLVNRAKETPVSGMVEGVFSSFSIVLRPFENLAFGRLMKRGRKCGAMMGRAVAKVMSGAMAFDDNAGLRPKVTFMANSLGAHMLIGALNVADEMPYRIHAVFFVQGAIALQRFDVGNRYSSYAEKVAGPVVCTHSDKDFMLKNVFGPFHGDALGFDGFPESNCNLLQMKNLDELTEEPYGFLNSGFNSVNCSEYIDEGNAIAGGHGDFKEDETTTLYWNMINVELDDSAYDK